MRGGLRCALRASCFLLLILLLSPREIVLGTAAAAWNRRDRLDPLDLSRDEYYRVQDSDLYCRKCPAGTYVAEHCHEQRGSSRCLPCTADGYIAYPNSFTKCLGCQTCREDQVELKPCQATSDTQCACRNGTFCSPDHPCEMCQKCQPRCGEGEVELAPCTPHSDRRCGPATPSSSSLAGQWIAFIVLAIVVMLVLGCCCCFCHSPGDRRYLSRTCYSAMNYLLQQLRRYQRRDLGTRDNNHNTRVCQDQLLPGKSDSGIPSAPALEVIRRSSPSSPPRRTLVSVAEGDPITILRRSLDIFAQDVPCKDWRRFGRALDLSENDIDLAFVHNEPSLEPFFQMLNTWLSRQGMRASVDILLDALHRINLGGIAETITSKLVQQGDFQYEGS
ncbi:tumor necrosis factor receptor superfamily member 10A-like [Heliangelus exortis]|uniref:tumor necrosis factor receptor superfamily member 10A-like n=1 Tax=Heliangelus exortis TaxID=472823 RepID=UPI003A9371EB